MRNKYYKRSKISEAKFRQLLRYFAMDFTATQTAELTGISRRSVNSIYALLRLKVQQWVNKQAPFNGIVEVDESYFGPRRVPGKRGRGHRGKPWSLASLNGKARYTPRSYLMLLQRPYRAL